MWIHYATLDWLYGAATDDLDLEHVARLGVQRPGTGVKDMASDRCFRHGLAKNWG